MEGNRETRMTAKGRLALAGLIAGACAVSGTAQMQGFVQRTGYHFTIDGRRVYFAGTNNYYQMIRRRTWSPGVNEVLDEMAARGMNLLRTWAFQDDGARTWDCLICAPAAKLGPGQRPIDFINEATLVGLDQTLAACRARGIRAILTFVNNWDDFGGMNRWTVWRFGSANHDQFYIDPTIRGWYKELMALLIGRVNTVTGVTYRDDPTIFAWQLANEPRLMSSGVATPAQFTAWIGEMSAYVKSIDPNHMVSTGSEGFYGPAHSSRNTDTWMSAYGQDFIFDHQHATIDFATCHVWPHNWGWNPIGNTGSALAKATQYVQQRITDAENLLGKPLVVEEFGIPRDNFGTGPNSGPTLARDRFFREVFIALGEASARRNGAFGGSAVWIVFDNSTATWDDGNGIFLPQDATTDALLSAHAQYVTSLPNPDLDLDGDVDPADAEALQACMGQPGEPPPPGCAPADVDGDGDADQSDFGITQRCLDQPDKRVDLDCTE